MYSHYILSSTLRPFYAPYLSELSCKPPSAVALVPSLCVYLDVSYDIILKIPVLGPLLNQIAVAWNSSSRLKNGTFKPLKQCMWFIFYRSAWDRRWSQAIM